MSKQLMISACFLLSSFALCAEGEVKTETTLSQAKDYNYLLGMPGFSDELLKMHFKLYEGYIKNAQTVSDSLRIMREQKKMQSYEFGAMMRRFGWECDGARLHEYYFDNLGGNGKLDTSTSLYQQIVKDFGSYESWKSEFIATGLMRGIGWAILYKEPRSGKLVNTWINEHDVGHLAGGTPILVMDVFEHAYITQYALDRAKYIEAFFNNINWQTVCNRY